MLFSCEPVESSLGPPQKTEAQALQLLETETENLEKAINTEIDARAKYVKAATDASLPVKTAMLRLLRRIVLLGATPAQEAEVKRLLEAWEAAKKAVEQVEQRIESLIAELKNMDSETAKQAASTAEENVTAVTDAVEEVRQAKTAADITAAEAKVKTAVTTAKETVTKAKETAQKNEEAK